MGRPRKTPVEVNEVIEEVMPKEEVNKAKKKEKRGKLTPQQLAEKFADFDHESEVEKLATTYKIELKFIQPILGTSPADPEIYRNYLGGHEIDADTLEEEIEKIGTDEALDNRMTVFMKEDGTPLLKMHQIKGFLCSAAKALRRNSNSKIAGVTSYVQKIKDGVYIFNDEGDLYFPIIFDGDIAVTQRPCRTENAHGDPQVFLNASEEIPKGATCQFNLQLLCSEDQLCAEDIFELFDYGKYRGLLQWRNGGYGSFKWRVVEVTEAKIAKKDVA